MENHFGTRQKIKTQSQQLEGLSVCEHMTKLEVKICGKEWVFIRRIAKYLYDQRHFGTGLLEIHGTATYSNLESISYATHALRHFVYAFAG